MTSTIVARGSNRSQRPERTGKRYDEAAGDLRHENPNSARTVKLSMKPAVKLNSGATIAGGRGRRKTRSSLMIPPRARPHDLSHVVIRSTASCISAAAPA
jgi:hypothetical protein